MAFRKWKMMTVMRIEGNFDPNGVKVIKLALD